MKENKKLVNEIISDVKHDMSNEDIISLLADSRISACLLYTSPSPRD